MCQHACALAPCMCSIDHCSCGQFCVGVRARAILHSCLRVWEECARLYRCRCTDGGDGSDKPDPDEGDDGDGATAADEDDAAAAVPAGMSPARIDGVPKPLQAAGASPAATNRDGGDAEAQVTWHDWGRRGGGMACGRGVSLSLSLSLCLSLSLSGVVWSGTPSVWSGTPFSPTPPTHTVPYLSLLAPTHVPWPSLEELDDSDTDERQAERLMRTAEADRAIAGSATAGPEAAADAAVLAATRPRFALWRTRRDREEVRGRVCVGQVWVEDRRALCAVACAHMMRVGGQGV
eukprot:356150-Chlamydomonas_euryale.AAC.2